MNSVVRQTRFAGIARWVAVAALLVSPVCSVSQDRQNSANAGKDEDEIKQLISMYAKPADQADPTLASRVWCESPQDSLINPVGRWQGVEQIMGFYRHDMGEMYSERDLKISDVFRSGVLRCGLGRIQLGFLGQAKKREIISFIPWNGNPDLSEEPRQVVLSSCSLFRAAR